MSRIRLALLALMIPAAALTVAACGGSDASSGDGAATAASATAPEAAQQDVSGGADNYFDNNPTGENVLSILTTGYPDAIVGCNENTGYNPVAITNTTDEAQVVWANLSDQTIADQVLFLPQADAVSIQGCPQSVGGGPTSGWVTVAPGQTWVGGLAMGGSSGPDTNTNVGKNYLEVGGTPSSGTAASQWYDLQAVTGANGGYKGWVARYSKTGGTNPSQNQQAGQLNMVMCSASNQGGNLQFNIQTDQIMTPYRSAQSNAWDPSETQDAYYQWTNGMPICFAFLPAS